MWGDSDYFGGVLIGFVYHIEPSKMVHFLFGQKFNLYESNNIKKIIVFSHFSSILTHFDHFLLIFE
jgi:hypothetical protein